MFTNSVDADHFACWLWTRVQFCWSQNFCLLHVNNVNNYCEIGVVGIEIDDDC